MNEKMHDRAVMDAVEKDGFTVIGKKPSVGDIVFDYLHDHKKGIGYLLLIFSFVFLIWQAFASNPNMGSMGFAIPTTLVGILETPDLALMVILTILVLVLGSRERFSKLYLGAAILAALSQMAGGLFYGVVNNIFYFITGVVGFISIEVVAITAILIAISLTIFEMIKVKKFDLTKTSAILVASGLLFAAYNPATETLRLSGLWFLFGGLGLQTIELLRQKETSATITVVVVGIPVLVLIQILLNLVLKQYLEIPGVWNWLLALFIASAITGLLAKPLALRVAGFFQLPERLLPLSNPKMTDTVLYGLMIVSSLVVMIGHF